MIITEIRHGDCLNRYRFVNRGRNWDSVSDDTVEEQLFRCGRKFPVRVLPMCGVGPGFSWQADRAKPPAARPAAGKPGVVAAEV